jgi:hypothetical protein
MKTELIVEEVTLKLTKLDICGWDKSRKHYSIISVPVDIENPEIPKIGTRLTITVAY